MLKEGGHQMSDSGNGGAARANSGNGGAARANNGNGSIVRTDNGNGGAAFSGDGNMHHSYSFEVKRGNFSLRVQLEFQDGQVHATDNSNGDAHPDNTETSGPASDNGNGSGMQE
jgi:hypothetical protein